MKRNILNLCIGVALTAAMVGCSDFLETESYTSKTSGNFPVNEADMQAMIAGVYAVQNDYDKNMMPHPYFVSEYASDERYGSSGQASTAQGYDKLMVRGDAEFDPFWATRYKGIFRANMAIESIDKVKSYSSQESRDQFLGEAYFLRALYYWDLCQLFETVPLKTTSAAENIGRATVDEMYAQMGSDFIQAINLLPNKPYNSYKSGQATRWAAEGYLGRIYLFYCGMYKDNNLDAGMPLVEGTLSKSDMIGYIDDCINNSGHALVPNFLNLWTYSNSITAKDWDKSQELGLEWAGEDNSEVMYKYKYSLLVKVGNNLPQRNYFVLNQGFPGTDFKEEKFPYGSGWAVGWVVPSMWEEWTASEPDDIRRWGSIVNVFDEVPGYDLTNPSCLGLGWENTGYRNKKHLPIMAKNDAGKIQNSFGVQMWGTNDNLNQANIEDFVLMRFAEIYLMQSELKGTADGMNTVRHRAGLADKAYSLENIQNERRWELAFEGLRWNDIRRWGIAEERLAVQVGQTVYNEYHSATVPNIGGGYVERYKKTRGFFPIPISQIALSEGRMTQNPGWDASDNYIYSGWPK